MLGTTGCEDAPTEGTEPRASMSLSIATISLGSETRYCNARCSENDPAVESESNSCSTQSEQRLNRASD